MRTKFHACSLLFFLALSACRVGTVEDSTVEPLTENAVFEVYRDSVIELHVPRGLTRLRDPFLTQFVNPVDTGTEILLYRNDRTCYDNLGAFRDPLSLYGPFPTSRSKKAIGPENSEGHCQRLVITSRDSSLEFSSVSYLKYPNQVTIYKTGGLPGGEYTHLVLFQTDRFYYSIAYLSDLQNDPTWEDILRSLR